MMHWIYSAIVGLVIGLIARFLFPGPNSMGLIMTMILGLVGAYVGTAIGHFSGQLQKNANAGWFWSIIGAVVVLAATRLI